VTTREVRAGEVVLAEEPLLTYLEDDTAALACAGCLKWRPRVGMAGAGWRSCRGCGWSHWCSEACEAQDRSRSGGHSAARCAAHAALAETFKDETSGDGSGSSSSGVTVALLSYVTAALELRTSDPDRYALLAQQCDSANLDEAEQRAVAVVSDTLHSCCPELLADSNGRDVSHTTSDRGGGSGGSGASCIDNEATLKTTRRAQTIALVSQLARQDKCNSFGYLAPLQAQYGSGGEADSSNSAPVGSEDDGEGEGEESGT